MSMWFKKKTETAQPTAEPKELSDIAKHIILLLDNGKLENEFREPGEPYHPCFRFNDLVIIFDGLLNGEIIFKNVNGLVFTDDLTLSSHDKEYIRQAMIKLWRKNRHTVAVRTIKTTLNHE